ncbi:FAD-binding oxidoreductase [Defluviimonas sp. WL0002]|uniref:FAD-binding oxidoreductase n=1 Tax=Albidovulum marisflavi TaxID=2984159 RepID=A0ABT2Z9K4_9RHOB|nr:FAD-binding oxidoreductase [Defluviimonas sp. WL0002]MCV2867819.1 FAD-binding oxidoreductase [Defluviimonas sp. WL0002]
MKANGLFSSDFKAAPYWWDRTPRPDLPQAAPPSAADVVIIGSGYTGLHAAVQTARAGLSTVVLDAEAAGWGCSTRNGGQISTSVKPGFAALARHHGADTARAILHDGQASLAFVGDFVRAERIDCDFRVVGRFHGAHLPRSYAALARDCAAGNPVFQTDAFMVQPDDMAAELGTAAYSGGCVFPHHASIDPARYHAGLLRVAQSSGAAIVPHCPATSIERETGVISIRTPRGSIRTGRAIIATNGYTGALSPWHQRRIIPIGSYMIATEPIAPDLMDRLFPTDRVVTDTRKLVYYYRPSPDRSRILFGGRVSVSETDPRKSAYPLHAELTRLFPELSQTRVSHSWMGFVGYTFDTLAHVGETDGIMHAMGYCGSGVGMASYLGMKLGRRAAGLAEADCGHEGPGFPTRPLYSGRPWFLAPMVAAYRLRDRFGL